MLHVFLKAVLVVWVYMTVFFVAALARKDNSVADVAWGPGFFLACVAALSGMTALSARPFIATALVGIWGFRLAFHIAKRNRGKGEDPRYAKWRREWGKWFVLRSYLQVFILQGFLMLVIASSVIVINAGVNRPFGLADWAGIGMWVTGFLFEVVGDVQLARFKGDPSNKGKVMDRGLWRYTRHPNYFGEATMWWGLYVMALGVEGGWLTLASPVTITFLLLKVSGVPMLEKGPMAERPGYREYVSRTNAFFPWFPKKPES
jgi:steroid 5-alpha reductase family enzyme